MPPKVAIWRQKVEGISLEDRMDAATSQVALGATRSKEVRQESPQDPQENTALETLELKGASGSNFELPAFWSLREYIYVYPQPLSMWLFKTAAKGNRDTSRLSGVLWVMRRIGNLSWRLSQIEFPAILLAFLLMGACLPPSLGGWDGGHLLTPHLLQNRRPLFEVVALCSALPFIKNKTKKCMHLKDTHMLHSGNQLLGCWPSPCLK